MVIPLQMSVPMRSVTKIAPEKQEKKWQPVIYLLKSFIMGLAVLVSLTERPFIPQASWNNKGSCKAFKCNCFVNCRFCL